MRRLAALLLVGLLAACAAPRPPVTPPRAPVSGPTAAIASAAPRSELDRFLGHLRDGLTAIAKARGQIEAAITPGIRVTGADPVTVRTWLLRQRDQLDAIAAALLETVKRVEQAKADGVLIEAPAGSFQGGVGQ